MALGGSVDPHRLQPIHRPVGSQGTGEIGVAKDIAAKTMNHKQGGGLAMGLEGHQAAIPNRCGGVGVLH